MTEQTPGLRPAQRAFVALQHTLPQHLLSDAVFQLARLRLGPLTGLAIRGFARWFDVDLAQALHGRVGDYPSFNAFFTRALQPGARPLDADPRTLVSPVDGTLSTLGNVRGGRVIQAKGRDYRLDELLGGDLALARELEGGQFATLYLSPRDYHRIHLPVDGELTTTTHVPGRLFSVNPTTAAGVPRLFARNERLVCRFQTDLGALVLVLVGAIFVGSIETRWAGRITPPRGRRIDRRDHAGAGIRYRRGEEIGRFNMGSTVILLMPPDAYAWASEISTDRAVRMGQRLARPAASS